MRAALCIISVSAIWVLAGCGPNRAYWDLMCQERFSHSSPTLVFPAPVAQQIYQQHAEQAQGGTYPGTPMWYNERPLGAATDGRYEQGEVIHYYDHFHDRQSDHSPNRFYRHIDIYREGVYFR